MERPDIQKVKITDKSEGVENGQSVETSLMSYLILAAFATAAFASLAHIVLIFTIEGSFRENLLHLFALSAIVSLVIAFIGGFILLTIVQLLALKLIPSFILFFAVIPLVFFGLEMLAFDIGLIDLSWQYLWISVPTSFVAWYFSVFCYYKKNQELADE